MLYVLSMYQEHTRDKPQTVPHDMLRTEDLKQLVLFSVLSKVH